ncbi:hypothetical protein HY989_03840 [Candidatus Micrarchaeota archaeon]|nr:hypothetical protein [Candidatus Micrarchaeota archaeon]
MKGSGNYWILLAAVVLLLASYSITTSQKPKLPIVFDNNEDSNAISPTPISTPKAITGQIALVESYTISVDAPSVLIEPAATETCGDGYCTLSERCDLCEIDCGCDQGSYCSSQNGICYKSETCGDNTCTTLEKQTSSCCQDCGCTNAAVCSQVSQKCSQKVTLTDEKITSIVNAYLKEKSLPFRQLSITDSYYGSIAVKAVELDCTSLFGECRQILYIDSKGNVIEAA